MRLLVTFFLLMHVTHTSNLYAFEVKQERSEKTTVTGALARVKAKLQRLERAYGKASRFVGLEASCRQQLGAFVLTFEQDLKAIASGPQVSDELSVKYEVLTELVRRKGALMAESHSEFPFAEAEVWVRSFCRSAYRVIDLLAHSGIAARAVGQGSRSGIDAPVAKRLKANLKPRTQASVPSAPKAKEALAVIDESLLEPLQRDVLGYADRKGIASYRAILALSGMDAFKKYATDVVIDSQFREEGDAHGTYHCAFVGAPGTGKTTVGRLYGALLFELGVIGATEGSPKFTEVSRTDLVGAHIGETEKKTAAFLRASLGGVLFIDEAHNLGAGSDNSKDFGHRAVNVINKFMEDQRDKIVVVFAGYEEQMEDFINEDPGLRSRISKVVTFPDLTSEQLLFILAGFYQTQHFTYDSTVLNRARVLLAAERDVETLRGKNAFSNGRAVRNLFERSLFAQKRRLFVEYQGDIKAIPEAARFAIQASDLE